MASSPESNPGWPAEKIGRVARLVELDDVKLIQALVSGIPESEFEPSKYHSTWNVIPFFGEGPLEPGEEDQLVDIREGIEVVVAFDYHLEGAGINQEGNGADSPDEPVVSLHVVATFLVQYSIKEVDEQPRLIDQPVEVKSTDIHAFSDFNATFNAWPYWREFVQSMTGRMGLPTVIIPVLPVPNLIGRTRSR